MEHRSWMWMAPLAALWLVPATGAAQDEGAAAEPAADQTAAPADTGSAPAAGDYGDTEAPPAAGSTSSGSAQADSGETPDDFRNSWVTIGVLGGVYLPDIINKMQPHALVSAEVGLLLPFLERRLGIVIGASWSPPWRNQTLMDPRLGMMGTGTWNYTMQTSELMASAGLIFRFLPPGSTFVPYIAAKARAYMLQTQVNGASGGNSFGRNTEKSMQWGFVGSVGGELRLGPGALVLDVSFGIANLPHTITGHTSTGALGVQLGYRIFL